jgi:hypothetical protein
MKSPKLWTAGILEARTPPHPKGSAETIARRMASGNLRIFGDPARPFSQAGADERNARDKVLIGRVFLAGQFFGLV